MKKTKFLILALAALAVAGCSTVDSRIAKHQTEFDSWPPAVQQKVRAKQVDLGFTPAGVHGCWASPDRKYMRTTAQGTTEVWAYRDDRAGVRLRARLWFGGRLVGLRRGRGRDDGRRPL